MVVKHFIPDTADIVWLDFDPQAGHEQRGRRPALVLSAALYNGKSGLAIVCPITSQVKGYPFEVLVRAGRIKGAILSDQVRSVDWRIRNAQRAGKAPSESVDAVRQNLAALLG